MKNSPAMEFLFEGIRLRPTEEPDLDFVSSLENHPDNARFITPWTREKHQASLRSRDFFHGVLCRGERRVGFFILAGLESPHQSVEFLRIVVGEKGQGVGHLALQALKKYCFEELHAHRLWLDVKTFNERAKHLYLSEGFIVEGTLRDCLKTGNGFESLTLMSMLAGEYKKAKETADSQPGC